MIRPALAALTLREWRTSWTDRTGYLLRAGYAAALLLGVGFAWAALPTLGVDRADEFPALLRALFGWFTRAQFVLATMLASLTFARAVCREQERGTLDLLLLAPLTKVEILLAKLIGEFLGLTALVLAGLPVVLLLIPLGGISPLEILSLHAILLSQILIAGGLSVAFAAIVGRPGAVMLLTWGTLVLLATGANGGRAWIPGAFAVWNTWESLSLYHFLELQLGSVSVDPSLAVHALLLSAAGAVVCCLLGSLMLERRVLKGGRGWSLSRLLRRVLTSRRLGWLVRPFGRSDHPLLEHEGSLYRDAWFRVLWIGFILTYGEALRRVLVDPRSDYEKHVIIAVAGIVFGVLATIVLGAFSVGADRRRGMLETLLAAGVSPEDMVRSRWRGLFKRALFLLTLPAIHLTALFAREASQFGEFAWRLPGIVLGYLLGTAMLTGVTVWYSLGCRRAEVGAFLSLLLAPIAALCVLSSLAGHLVSLALGLPLVVGALMSGYAMLIRRVPRYILG